MERLLSGLAGVITLLTLSMVVGFGFYFGAYSASRIWPVRIVSKTIVRNFDMREERDS